MIAMLIIPYLTYYDVILCAYLSVCSFILEKRFYLILKPARDWLQYKRFGHYTSVMLNVLIKSSAHIIIIQDIMLYCAQCHYNNDLHVHQCCLN